MTEALMEMRDHYGSASRHPILDETAARDGLVNPADQGGPLVGVTPPCDDKALDWWGEAVLAQHVHEPGVVNRVVGP